MSLKAAPVTIVVECEIKNDRIDEFLDVIEKDAVGSRKEPGCLRFGAFFSKRKKVYLSAVRQFVDVDTFFSWLLNVFRRFA